MMSNVFIAMLLGILLLFMYDSAKLRYSEPFYSIGDEMKISSSLKGVIIDDASTLRPSYKLKFKDGATNWYTKEQLMEWGN